MSDVETAIAASKRFEAALETKFGAAGKGLHEKTTSVEHLLHEDVLRHLRLVATIRNRIVHEEGFDKIPDPTHFAQACAHLDLNLCSDVPANALPLGAFVCARYENYKGFGSDSLQWLTSGKLTFRSLTARWEAASGLRFVDTPECIADQEHWVLFIVNQHIVQQINRGAPGLALVTTAARANFEFALYPHVTSPSPACARLLGVARALGRSDPLISRAVRVGVDSAHREAVLMQHFGVSVQKNFLGMRVVKRVAEQCMVSLA